jgi:hypothetical protein
MKIRLTIDDARAFGRALRAYEPAAATFTDPRDIMSEDRDQYEIQDAIAEAIRVRFGVATKVAIYYSSGMAIGSCVPDTGHFLATKL